MFVCKREGLGIRLCTTAIEFLEVIGHNSLPLAVVGTNKNIAFKVTVGMLYH